MLTFLCYYESMCPKKIILFILFVIFPIIFICSILQQVINVGNKMKHFKHKYFGPNLTSTSYLFKNCIHYQVSFFYSFWLESIFLN